MPDDCRNDCTPPLRFPRRPHNAPGLARLSYRIGSYTDFREALLRNLNQTATLEAWTHRGADDPGIALLEGAAILGDILTFYQELYANEAYLRTARWRESISDLVRLLGYRLSPGLGGNATFAFEVKGDKPVLVPAKFPVKVQVEGLEKPADFETSEGTLAFPHLSRFHLYRPMLAPSIEATTEEFYISVPDQSVSPVALKAGDRLLVGAPTQYLPPGPTRMLNSSVVIVDAVRELHGMKIFKLKGTLNVPYSTSILGAYKLGRTFKHFGHNGSPKITRTPKEIVSTSVVDGKKTTTTTTPAPEYFHSFLRDVKEDNKTWELFKDRRGLYPATRTIDPTISRVEFPLDSDVKDLPTGATLILQASLYKDKQGGEHFPPKEFSLVRTVNKITSASITWGLVTGATSILTLNAPVDTYDGADFYNFTDIRQLEFYETTSPLLTLRAAPQEDAGDYFGILKFFYGTDAELQTLAGRRLMFEKPGAETIIATVTDVWSPPELDPLLPALRYVYTDPALNFADFPNENPTVTVYGNLVEATQGKTEAEAPLGNGDARQAFQTFKLPKSPLTYKLSAGDAPPEVAELEIYVNGRRWRQVASFFGRKYDEEIYIVREDAEDVSWVQFGDGRTGARLPSGMKNVVAKYRTGTGAYGALKPETTVQAGAKLDRLERIRMPAAASGGSAPEDGENAREAAPGKIQSLDRLVSLKDFESETLAVAGVARASAAWQLEENIPSVVLTVLMETGRDQEIEQVREVLADYDRCRGPQRFPVVLRQGKRQHVAVSIDFSYDASFRKELIEEAIRRALGTNDGKIGGKESSPPGLFSLRNRRFGQREYLTTIEGVVQNVAGVVWVKVKALYSLGDAADVVGIPPVPFVSSETIACDGEHILSLYEGHLELNGSAAASEEVC
ncbi:MAG TPA: hypothetical protein VER76_15245 [Pyrinomonadaceae bacterium]|nr:hypothetical protein [Pyrinomonadaceae bacterium]